MTYGALVVYEVHWELDKMVGYTENRNRILSLNFKPNTPNGVQKMKDLILDRENEENTSPITKCDRIVILNLIPLERDPKTPDSFEYEME